MAVIVFCLNATLEEGKIEELGCRVLRANVGIGKLFSAANAATCSTLMSVNDGKDQHALWKRGSWLAFSRLGQSHQCQRYKEFETGYSGP